jgi:hypothetical protein
MPRKLFLAALLIPFCALALAGPAQAQTVYTPDSLAPLLLTSNDVSAVLSAIGSSQSFDNGQGVPSRSDPVAVGRVFTAGDGSLLDVTLFSLADGSAPSGDLRDGILNGQFMLATLGGGFSNIQGFNPSGSISDDGQDVIAQGTGDAGGTTYNIVADTFIHGNVFGILFYAATGSNDGRITGAMLGGQEAKLP